MSEVEKLQGAEALSALVDGEADAGVAMALSSRWRDDPGLRGRWHAYQLIGDALRSDELAGGGHDAAFLARLRDRLDREPVVLAPAPAMADAAVGVSRRRAVTVRRWAAPAAIAAGFVAVVGTLSVTRMPASQAPAAQPQLARATVPAAPVVAAAPTLAAVSPVVAAATTERAEPATGVLLRDARLDRYLAAHEQFGGSSALGVPSGFLRNATYDGSSLAVGSGAR